MKGLISFTCSAAASGLTAGNGMLAGPDGVRPGFVVPPGSEFYPVFLSLGADTDMVSAGTATAYLWKNSAVDSTPGLSATMTADDTKDVWSTEVSAGAARCVAGDVLAARIVASGNYVNEDATTIFVTVYGYLRNA